MFYAMNHSRRAFMCVLVAGRVVDLLGGCAFGQGFPYVLALV